LFKYFSVRYTFSETARSVAVSFSGKYNPAVQSSGSRNNDRATFSRANVLDKNAVSLATGVVFPQRSTATDGNLRRRAPFGERISISARITLHLSRVTVSAERQRDFATGIYYGGRCILYHKHRKIDVNVKRDAKSFRLSKTDKCEMIYREVVRNCFAGTHVHTRRMVPSKHRRVHRPWHFSYRPIQEGELVHFLLLTRVEHSSFRRLRSIRGLSSDKKKRDFFFF